MKKINGNDLHACISFAIYTLSGTGIFFPLQNSDNILLSLITCLIVSSCLLFFFIKTDNLSIHHLYAKSFIGKFFSIIISLCGVAVLLMLLTEVVKDTSFITNKDISLRYYTLIAISLLLVNLYLSSSSSRVVFRFITISAPIWLFMIIVIFMPFTTVKGGIFDFEITSKSLGSSIIKGAKSGLFFTIDSVFYLLLFRECYTKSKNTNRSLCRGLIVSYIYIFAINLITCVVFGNNLSKKLEMPDYSLTRLIYGFDITELVSAIRIVSFLIKGTVYMKVSSSLITAAFCSLSAKNNIVILCLHLLLPALFLSLAIYDKSPKYGEYQSFIYPTTVLLSVILIVYLHFFQKKQG